ncbi:hypothetical protein ACFWPU_36965 [Streptomyces sp. NPDC058471]|uniref:hypothetical protein n=1 Tax=Streptomyces sp. NPDC058471 TaxID=3346516 RepID=UPI003646A813
MADTTAPSAQQPVFPFMVVRPPDMPSAQVLRSNYVRDDAFTVTDDKLVRRVERDIHTAASGPYRCTEPPVPADASAVDRRPPLAYPGRSGSPTLLTLVPLRPHTLHTF